MAAASSTVAFVAVSASAAAVKPLLQQQQLKLKLNKNNCFPVPGGLSRTRRNCLRVNAIAIAKKWEPTKVVPQADRVLIRLKELPEKSAGGVLLPKSAVKFERYLMGEVLSVGSEVEVGEVETGKKVLFSDINAYEVDLGTDARHCFCKVGDLLAVVE